MLKSADQILLKNSRIALLGCGAQGTAEATNLKRSEIPFVLGLRKDGPSFARAEEAGFQAMDISEAVESADTVVMNLPDQVQASVYQKYLAGRHLKRLVFAHGFNTHFGLIPVTTDGPAHVLVAPKGAASGLIQYYGTDSALPAILAVQMPSENTNEREAHQKWAEAYARAIGCHGSGLIWADFKDETDCDLFSEQVLLCGGVSSLLRASYDVLLEAGYNPEAAYFETLFELKLIVDLMWKRGISGMREKISPTARYGDVTRGDRVIDESVKNRMREILKEIQEGVFAKEFLKQYGSDAFHQKEEKQKNHPLETIGKRLREKLEKA